MLFVLKIALLKNLHLQSFINCNEYYYDECVRHLNVRIGEHIITSPLTKKKVKGSTVGDHLLLCNHSPCFENFSVLTKENRKFALELKGNLLIMTDKPSLNKNIVKYS